MENVWIVKEYGMINLKMKCYKNNFYKMNINKKKWIYYFNKSNNNNNYYFYKKKLIYKIIIK